MSSKDRRLTPEIAYILGWWHLLRHSKGGLGIRGKRSKDFIDWYRKYLSDEGNVKKIGRWNEYIIVDSVKGRGILIRTERERRKKFRFVNEYSAAYFAALYEASREFARLLRLRLRSNEFIGDIEDLMLINSLGFYADRVRELGDWIVIKVHNYDVFSRFISSYLSYLPKDEN
ncbi:MAG: hypothetical protein NZ908_01275 [Candidatus Micrarchaeota archaeon]|nr:hypothetical protein [Candidatus Micrarchaeota archaeon]MCX8154252.1 hypothetical protein [Candidatus Micrarchaeota archaeon]